MALEAMRYFLSCLLLSFSLGSQSEYFECTHHPDWPKDRAFTAVIELEKVGENVRAKFESLNLSDVWPLNSQCDFPSLESQLIGYQEGNEFKLGAGNEKECSFILYLVSSGSAPTMLSPRKTYKVFGEKPYLAQCRAI